MVFQVHQVFRRESVALKSTLCILKKIFTLQNLDETMVYHVLHGLAQATSGADGSVTSCKGMVHTRFQNWNNQCFSPGSWYQDLCPYTMLHGQQKLLACRWEVIEHLALDAAGTRECVAVAFSC
jgi:hypothetical protein